MDAVKTAAKAWVAATVALAGAYVAMKWGYQIPDGVSEWLVGGIIAAVSGAAVYFTPNKPPEA